MFCKAPWVSIQYGSVLLQGGVTPCCEWNDAPFKGALKDYLSSDWLSDLKNIMQNDNMGYIRQSCSSCLNSEKLNIRSTRQQLESLEINQGIQRLDYRPDNICNLKCRMCFPNNSSLIAKEQNYSFNLIDTSDIYQFDFSTVTSINIVGGEPSISKDVDTFLKWLIDNHIADNIKLTVTINATNANAAWIDKLKKFKQCYTIISLDGTDKIYDYIRTNANWNSIVKNIKSYEFESNVIFYQITGSMYNIPVIEKWINWFDDKEYVSLHPVESQPSLTLFALPDSIRFEKMNFLESINNEIARTAYAMLDNTRFDYDTWNEFKKYTQLLDRVRKTDITTLDPIFKEIMEFQ